jgi:hypothetical protein
MQVGTTLVTYAEASEACQPGKAAFHHPPVPSEVGAAVHATSCNPGLDAASPALPTAAPMIVAFVGVQLVRAPAWATTAFGPYTRYSVQRGNQHHAVVPVGPAQRHAERGATGISDEMALRAGPAAIRRVRSNLGTPFFAARLALSRAARRQSSCPASCSRSSSSRCNRVQTPAACHSPSLRQHVLPQQPSSAGTSCHWIPVRSTNRIPARAKRSGTRGRPPFGFARSGGRRGLIVNQRSSGTSNAMPPQRL